MILLTIIVFLVILGLLIFVHELGHFVSAKRSGMKVEEFGFGFPPRIFGIKRGETIYSINWIPLGGFVKILGEDSGTEGAESPRSFQNGTFWNRFKVLVAGVAMNFVFAWFLLFLGLAWIGTPLEVNPGTDIGNAQVRSESQITIVQVQSESPAEIAGFKSGDAVLSIDGQTFTSIPEMIAYTESQAGNTVTYELARGEERVTYEVVPREEPGEGQGAVGFLPAQIAVVTYPFFEALGQSFISIIARTWAILLAFGALLGGLLSRGELIEGVSGPIGIAALTRDFIRLGPVYLTQFTAILSINLGILNILPFPALDGGRVMFLLIEKIRGVKSKKWEHAANTIGFLLLILLMVLITVKDVTRFF